MKYRHLSVLVIVLLFFSLSIVACGDDGDDTTTGDDTITTSGTTGDITREDDTDPDEAAWVGVWTIVLEDGRTPAENAYNSVTLTLDASTFSSTYDGSGGLCTWSGTNTTTADTMTWIADASTGWPCDQAIGDTFTAQMTLSADGNSLTLDWTANAGLTLQEYERVS
jgi:hypothetical protein